MRKIISMLFAAMLLLSACTSTPIAGNDNPAVTPAVDEPVPGDQGNDPQVTPLSGMEELAPSIDAVSDFVLVDYDDCYSKLGEFSFKLYGLTEDRSGLKNSVFSPMSAGIALGMLSSGTSGETADELANALGVDRDAAASTFYKLIGEYAALDGSSETVLSLANAAFFSPRLINAKDWALFPLRDAYRAQSFRGELSTDSAREFINGWVSEKTEGEIPSVLSENLDEDTVMVLINTILLDAKWARSFKNLGYERKMQFTCANGETAELDCLADTRNTEYIDTDELIGAIMDYSDGRLKFMAVKPKDGDIGKLMEGLDYAKFASTVEAAQDGECIFQMPKFSIESQIDLNDCVKELGAGLIFDPDYADLSGFGESEDGNVFVSEIFQKAKIDVDEDGTRAAAATVIATAPTSAPIFEYKEIILDSSFFWCVYDSETDLPLFMGLFTGNE